MEKTIVVARNEVFKIERLQDRETGESYFLIRNDRGETVRASEIVAGNVLFTTDPSKMRIQADSLHFDLFTVIETLAVQKDVVSTGMLNGEAHTYISTQNLAYQFNTIYGFEKGLNARTIGRLCRELGFQLKLSGFGYAVVLDEPALQAVRARVDVSFAPGENMVDGNR